jgi:GAF domain-containing protein
MTASTPSSSLARDEARRIAALQDLGVLDTDPDPVFDAITASAAQACGAPIALISLIDTHRQWFKSNLGLTGVTQTPRDVAFCDHAIRDETLLEVPDATLDARFAGNPLVTGHPDIRFYAGAPIVVDGGARIGTVCVIDRTARQLDATQRATLASLAAITGSMLTQRRQLLDATTRLADSERRVRRLYEASPAILHSIGPDGRILARTARLRTPRGAATAVVGLPQRGVARACARSRVAGILPHRPLRPRGVPVRAARRQPGRRAALRDAGA